MAKRQHLIETEKQKVIKMFKKGQRKIDIAKIFGTNYYKYLVLHDYHKNYKMISRIWNC